MAMYQVHPLITQGQLICKKLHKVYCPNQKWETKISNKIARLFSQLKLETRKMFTTYTEVEMLEKINSFTLEDFKELCEITIDKQDKDVLHGTVTTEIGQ
jgi:hypothetical protein